MRVRDAIHGFITYNETEERVLNVPIVQRLRRIRQAALTHYVYPGVTHTRFEHSIGVMHLSGKLGERMNLCDGDIEAVRLAGLLHDIGHGPFSHVSEQCLEMIGGKADSNRKIHESITLDLIRTDEDLRSALGNEMADRVEGILGGSVSLLRSIVTGPIDADRLDYLIRDSHYAGVRYGVYDLEMVVCSAIRYHDDLVFSERALYAIEQMLLARHHITQQVYMHPIRLITDAMLIRMVGLAADADPEFRRSFTYAQDDATFLQSWLTLDDESLLCRVEASHSAHAREMARRIRQRHLYKLVFKLPLTDGGVRDGKVKDALENVGFKQCRLAEEKVAELLAVKSSDVIVQKVKEGTAFAGRRIPATDMLYLVDEGGTRIRFSDHPQAVVNDQYTKQTSIHVYCGFPKEQKKSDRDAMMRKERGALQKVLLEMVEGI